MLLVMIVHVCYMVPLASRQVPGNLASFLKQASLDTAMAMLQPREATPPTPMARQPRRPGWRLRVALWLARHAASAFHEPTAILA